MSDTQYSFLDKFLHRTALGSPLVARMSFEFDQRMATDPDAARNEPHVFIAGLARAGTTILMRRFHASGAYRSLTYRDMPFVLAPNFWRRLSGLSRRETGSTERAHGDGLLIDGDSPESFDEVFWRIFTGQGYLHKTYLTPHRPPKDVVERYRGYVSAVLESGDRLASRYLCKNNNNVLRLAAIHAALPKALILIPIREPVAQAQSLLTQHRRFSSLQAQDSFMLSYMNWLGHHEFGLGHRPFRFSKDASRTGDPNTLDYWLGQWCDVYDWLERTKPASALFVCYEDLCTDRMIWRRLAAQADIPPDVSDAETLKLRTGTTGEPASKSLAEIATQTYKRLRVQAYDILINAPDAP